MNNNLLIDGLDIIPASHFNWSGNQGFCEASEMLAFVCRQVYADACDEGFAVQGKNERIAFVETNIERDREGDLLGIEYNSISPVTGRLDGRFTIFIIND